MPNLGYRSPSPAALAANKKAAADAQAAQQAGLQKYANIAIGDLNSGNYAGALQAGLDSGKLYNTNYGSTTTDPLLQALESGQGLQQLDPTKKWDAASTNAYYKAFGASNVSNGTQAGTANAGESWGKNPYGNWSLDASKMAGDAATNLSTQGDNSAPDVQRFAGARPQKNFVEKYGTTIAALAATALSFGVAAPALAATLAADGIATGLAAGAIAGGVMGGLNTLAVDAITGKPITAGGVLGGALGGAAGGGLQGLASGAINNATGLGTTVSGGLAGAGIGAGRAALTGGNIGLGALGGGIGGVVQGSGIAGQLKTGLMGAGLSKGVSGALVNGGVNYAIGGVQGAAAGALMGGGGGAPSSGNGGGARAGVGAAVGVGGALLSQGANGGSNGGGNNGQGNIGNINMGNTQSTDTTLAGTIGGALPGILQAGAGVYGSQNAAEKQTQADQQAIGTQQSTLGNINGIWNKQQTLGQGADTSLGSALGTNGKPADYSGFENMPGYKFAVQQGTQAIQRQAASMGNAYTPNTATAVGQYVTGTAMQDYNTYISQLMGAAGLGNQANSGLSDQTYHTGANISTLQQNQGQAQASGVASGANAVGGLFSGPNGGVGGSLIGAAAKYLGGGGGGSAPGGGGFKQNGGSGGGIGNIVDNVDTGNFSGGGGLDYGAGYDPTAEFNSTPITGFGGSLDYGGGGDAFNFLGGP